MCDFVEHLRCMAVDLRHDWTLDLGIREIFYKRVRCEESGLDVDKFCKHNIRATVLGRDKAERSIGDSIHRRETDNGLGNRLPEIHTTYQPLKIASAQCPFKLRRWRGSRKELPGVPTIQSSRRRIARPQPSPVKLTS